MKVAAIGLLASFAAACSTGCRGDSHPESNCDADGTIGHLQGTGYELVLHRGTDEPLYTVKDKDGRVVIACTSQSRLRADQPEVYRALGPLLRTLNSPDFGYPPSTPPGLSKDQIQRLEALGYVEGK